ncbi:MAG: hypothetical protein IPG25_11980 [Proteobacteria bacterium]|nr:hypothetical protein [Pseudomonadota bacterium]
MTEASQSLQASFVQRFKSEAVAPQAMISILFKAATDQRDPVLVQFQTDAAGQTTMILNDVKYVIARSDIDLLLESSSNDKLNAKQSAGGEYVSVKALKTKTPRLKMSER